MRSVSKNWAVGLRKPYDGPTRTEFADTVYFMVFDGVKPSRIGIRADRVSAKTLDWDKKGIKWNLAV